MKMRNLVIGLIVGLIVGLTTSYVIVNPVGYAEGMENLNETGMVIVSEGILYYTPKQNEFISHKELKSLTKLGEVYEVVLDEGLEAGLGF